MQYNTSTPAEPGGFLPYGGAADSGLHPALRRLLESVQSQPSVMSIALSPQILRSDESRRAIMFQRAPRLNLDRFARFVQRSLDVSAAVISLVEADQQVFLCSAGLPEPWASLHHVPLTQALSQYPVTSGNSFIIEDAPQHPWLHTNAAMQETGMRAYAGVPLISMDGQILGALCVVDRYPRRWQGDQIEVLRRIALQVANHFSLDLSTQALRILMRQHADADALDRCMDVLGRAFGWDVVSLWEELPGAEAFGCTTLWRREGLDSLVTNAYLDQFRQLKMPLGTSLFGLVMRSGAPLWIPDIERETRVSLRTTLVKLQLRSAFMFPVTIGTRCVGVISGLSRESPPHGEDLRGGVAMLGGQVGAYLLKTRQQEASAVQ